MSWVCRGLKSLAEGCTLLATMNETQVIKSLEPYIDKSADSDAQRKEEKGDPHAFKC